MNVRSGAPYKPSQIVSPACVNMDMLSYVALPSPIWPLLTPDSSNSSGLANTLPSYMLVYLDSLPIIQSIFQGIPISSCSTMHQIQTAPCYDVLTFTTSRCTTSESTVAASAIKLTQCVATTETVTRSRFRNSAGSRSGVDDRISAQLLTYITGEPIYAPTPGAQTTVAPTDLPLSEARIAAIPASTQDANHGVPVETQGASATDGGMPAARILYNANEAYPSSPRGHLLIVSDSQIPQGGLRSTGTEHHLGNTALPTTSSQLEHFEILKIVLAIQGVASGLQSSHRSPQETDSRPASTESDSFQLTSAEHFKEDDGEDGPPPTATQNVEDVEHGMLPSGDFASSISGLSQESDRDTSVYLETVSAADSAHKSPGMRQPLPTSPASLIPATQTETLAPGGVLVIEDAHLSVLPDASGLALSNGSTLRLEDGEAAEIDLPDGLALQLSRSGTVYLANTRTADLAPQLIGTGSSGPLEPARTNGQITGEDVSSTRSVAEASNGVATEWHAEGTAAGDASLSRSISEASTGAATGGSAKGTASEVSAGGASVCVSAVWAFVVGLLVALVWVFDG